MKNTTKILLIFLAGLCLTWACRKIEVGFLSDYINYGNPLVHVTKGSPFVTPALLPDGSTKPLNVEMLEIRHKSGGIATDLMEVRPLTIWTEPFDRETDTTMEDVLAKMEVIDAPAFDLNSISGRVRFNENTRYATGDHYEYDLRISNVRGSKDYIGIGQVLMVDVPAIRHRTQARIQVVNMADNVRIYSQFETMQNHLDGTSEMVTIEKLSEESANGFGVTIHFQMVDRNGKPFSPLNGDLGYSWPGHGDGLAAWEYSSVDTEVLEDRYVYHFPAVPFPWVNLITQSYVYWHVLPQAVGEVHLPDADPDGDYWLNSRLNMDFMHPGTYKVVIHYSMVTHK